MKKLMIILCCLYSFSALAQKSQADRKFKLYEYNEAISLYRQYLEKNPADYGATKNLALACKYTNNISGSIETYRNLVKLPAAIPDDWYDLVQLLRISGQITEAKEFALLYQQKSDGEKAQNLIKSIDMYGELMAGMNDYSVVNKTPHLNQSVFTVQFHNGLIVTAEEVKGSKSDWTGRGYTKLYKTDTDFTRLVPFAPEIMSDLNDGIATFSRDGNTIYFTTVNKKSILEQDVNTSKLQISAATLQGGQWKLADMFQYNNIRYNTAHPALRSDGNLLVFSSDRPGGKGGMDLYYCVKQSDNSWSEPINMAMLNTIGNEIFPVWDPLDKLFFASNGLPGLGGLDVFVSINEGNTFGPPINLKAPINSSYDDFSLSTNDVLQSGYVSTNRFGTPETDDIAYFSKNVKEPEKKVVKAVEKPIVKITVLDKYTSIPLPYVSVSIKDSQNNLIFKGLTDPNGQLTVEELAADNYKVQGILNDITTTLATISMEEFSELLIERTITHNDPRFTLSGITINTLNGPPVSGVTVTCENTSLNRTNSIVTGEDGKFFFQLEQASDFKVMGEKKGWLSSEAIYETTKGLDRSKDLYVKIKLSMQQPTAKDVIRLDKIYYDYDKCDIKSRAAEELNRLIRLMNDYPDMIIELSSHTDSRGSNAYNTTLSQCRADAAVNYIVGKGIPAGRIVPKGYGETRLVNECADGVDCSEPKHQENRRTEFSILECPSCPEVVK
jgi:outer membrane protein OmpA-like peptidoglycan-associated protein/tetratricopeptide (TPR) repeat protein